MVSDEPDVPSRLSIERTGPTITISGELDAHSAPELRDEIDAAGDAAEITLDMSAVTFMDSSGLRVLIDAHQRTDQAGSQLVITRPSSSVQRVLEIAGVIDHLDVRNGSAPEST